VYQAISVMDADVDECAIGQVGLVHFDGLVRFNRRAAK
jgi:hypothetical protein